MCYLTSGGLTAIMLSACVSCARLACCTEDARMAAELADGPLRYSAVIRRLVLPVSTSCLTHLSAATCLPLQYFCPCSSLILLQPGTGMFSDTLMPHWWRRACENNSTYSDTAHARQKCNISLCTYAFSKRKASNKTALFPVKRFNKWLTNLSHILIMQKWELPV